MKQLKLIVAGLFLIFAGTIHAQVGVSVSVEHRQPGARQKEAPDIIISRTFICIMM